MDLGVQYRQWGGFVDGLGAGFCSTPLGSVAVWGVVVFLPDRDGSRKGFSRQWLSYFWVGQGCMSFCIRFTGT